MTLMQESMNDIENMLMKAQEDICAKLGITQEILEKVFKNLNTFPFLHDLLTSLPFSSIV